MAQKRMFSLHVVDTDKFMDMPTSAQALYFHLGMHGDDDGFVSSPRKIARAAGCAEADIAKLADEGFIIRLDDGVVVITDWKINNTIKSDRYSPTLYQAAKSRLQVDGSGRYHVGAGLEPEWNQGGSNMEPQYSVDKGSIDTGKVSTEENISDEHSFTSGGASSADYIESTAGIRSTDGIVARAEKSEEMSFEDLRQQRINMLCGR